MGMSWRLVLWVLLPLVNRQGVSPTPKSWVYSPITSLPWLSAALESSYYTSDLYVPRSPSIGVTKFSGDRVISGFLGIIIEILGQQIFSAGVTCVVILETSGFSVALPPPEGTISSGWFVCLCELSLYYFCHSYLTHRSLWIVLKFSSFLRCHKWNWTLNSTSYLFYPTWLFSITQGMSCPLWNAFT